MYSEREAALFRRIDELEAMLAAPPAPAVVSAEDAETLDFARNAATLLCGFMLDTNAIGPQEAGVNLVRSIKAMIATAQGG